jgi:predicted permease
MNLAETIFSTETLSFIFAGIIPIFVLVAVYSQLYVLFKFSRNTFYLRTLSTIFGNLTFFGIPFVTFGFPVDHLQGVATLAVITIGIVAIALLIALLEFYRLGESPKREGLRQVAKGLTKNPLIVSIVAGILISVV